MFNLTSAEIGSLIFYVLILSLLLSGLFIRASFDKGKKIKQISIWLLIIFLSTLFYNNRYILENFIPYKATKVNNEALQIQKSNDGHFYIIGQINNKNVLFMIDSGATSTTLTLDDAKRIGINISRLIFNQPVHTANGISHTASVFIPNMKVNEVNFKPMHVLISKDLKGKSLLGMNFLNNLKKYEIKQDKMFLYYK